MREGITNSYADWLVDLANEDLSGDALRNLLATRISSAEEIEQAAKEVEISRRVRLFMISLQQAEIEVPADFEAKLMARVSEDTTLMNLLDIYLSGFGRTLLELITAFLSFVPEKQVAEPNA